MPKKIKLDLNDFNVTSFTTIDIKGGAAAYSYDTGCTPLDSIDKEGCPTDIMTKFNSCTYANCDA